MSNFEYILEDIIKKDENILKDLKSFKILKYEHTETCVLVSYEYQLYTDKTNFSHGSLDYKIFCTRILEEQINRPFS